MATAKRDLSDPRVQGPRPTKDPLDRLIAMAIRVALREGLLADEPRTETEVQGQPEGKIGDRRSA